MPTTIDDYKWINNNEKLPGLGDYFECLTAITEIVDKAIDLKKNHARKNIILEWEPSEIVATELIGYPYVIPDTTALELSPTELRERFLIVVEELERFDRERATLLTTQTSISDGVIWGFWRKGYGKGSGLDGTEEFDVQHQSTDSDDPVPRWGTRQGYGDEAPVVSFDLQSFDQTGVT